MGFFPFPVLVLDMIGSTVSWSMFPHFLLSRRDFLGLVRMLGTTRNGVQLSPVPLNTGDLNCKTVATQTELCDSDTTTSALYSMLPAGRDGETSMKEAAGSPRMIPKPPSLLVLDDENLFGEQKSSPSLSLQTISIPARGEEETDEKRGPDMVNSVDANRPLNKREEEPKRKREEEPKTKREQDSVYPNTPPRKRRKSSTSYDACTSPYPGPGEAPMPPMIFGTPKTLLPGSRSGTSALDVPVPSSSVLGTPLGHNVQKAVGSASPSPSVSSASKGNAAVPFMRIQCTFFPPSFPATLPASLQPSCYSPSLPVTLPPSLLLPLSLPPSILPSLVKKY